ncbi:hypothetical protein LguiB_024202 [Lonicera macranthoides]
MECNRDDAIKAREAAEKRMQSNDFAGAQKMALKAKRLFPELENISHLLAVCDVHISAQSKVCGTEKDWYGILQVEKKADDITIKKQYRKLALVLHPDKNKFPGAEAAFKLIGEANMVLSDKGKRSLYDTKCRVSVPAAAKPPPHQANRNSGVRKPYGANNPFPSVPNSTFSGLNQHQPTKPDLSNGQQPAFWTCCPFCSIKYQYYRTYVNRALRCQNCSKPFIAHDIGAQGAPLGSNWGQPVFPQQKQAPNQAAFKVAPQSHYQSDVNSSHRSVRADQMDCEGLKTKGKDDGPKDNATRPKESETSRNTSRKRGRKSVEEPSDSFNSASSADTEEMGLEESGPNPTASFNSRRRSTRQKQQVSYNENVSDDDFTSPAKRSRESKSSAKSEEKENEAVDNEETVKQEGNASAPPEKSSLYGNSGSVKHQVNKEEPVAVGPDATKSSVIDDSETKPMSDPEVYDCPEPEFSDFDKDKEEHCFSVDQIWACYDTIDGMPRFYAQVRKVYSSEFKLRITWLEPEPEDEGEIEWVDGGLPVACGKFVRGDSEETSDRPMFSHQMLFKKVGKRNSYLIYPKMGEIWAVFKDWDIRWSSDPENHKKCELEVVEVLSNFGDFDGIRVAYLEKVKGFLSLFQKTIRGGVASFLIKSGELFRFSHRIPSFKMTGTEREGVPIGSFELDPASLPPDLNAFCQPNEVKMETGNMDHKVNGESMTGIEKMNTPKKKADFQRESFELRRSPRELKATPPKHLNGTKDEKHSEFTLSKENASCLADEKIYMTVSSTPKKVTEEVFYDFSKEKNTVKFQPGQIWAMYKDGLPKRYAQIKKIEYPPFGLQVQLLEPCTSSQTHCCGVFKVQTGKSLHSPSSFSHMVKANPNNKNAFEIYPKKGEIWAVYRNWSADFSLSDMKNCDYDIVEVVDDTVQSIEVSSMVQVTGFKFVFRAPRRQRSNRGVLVIPRVEIARFSHQIPAYQLTGEKEGKLRGYWELDPAALPSLCPEEKVESMMDTEKMSTPKKADFEREKFELRRSPRDLKTALRHSNGTKDQKHGESNLSKEKASSCLAAEKIYITVEASPHTLSEESFYDFAEEKSPAKFELGQIWAMYKDGLPKKYAQIKKIEYCKFGLHVQLLEPCTSTQALSCGIFKVQTEKTLHPPNSFSHLVNARFIVQNILEIHPRKGEIWAMYRNWNAISSHSHLENCEFDIVEVVEDTEQLTKVSSLERVAGFKSVFRAPRRQRSNMGFLVIPRAELGRFSHQIPAFQLTGEKGGRLRGFLELDPAAVPGKILD